MKRLKLNSIAIKLGTILVILFMVLIICIESVLYLLFIRFYTDDIIGEQTRRTHSYASVLSDHFEASTIGHVVRIESETNNLLLILDESGAIEGASDGISDVSPDYLSQLINHSSTEHGPVLASDWKNQPYFVTESFVTLDGKTIGRVVMFSPTEPIKTATKTLRSTFTGVALMVLVIGAIIILLVSGKIVQPLLRMIRITQRISEGKHDWELQTRGSDEIAQLSHAINRMSANIQFYKQQRRQFLADISHELRTPLTYMIGYSEVLLNGLVSKEDDQKRYLNLIYSQSIQLQRLVQDLFELANIEQGSFTLALSRTSIDKIMQNTLGLMAESIQQTGITLRYSPSQIPLYVEGDERRLQQVIVNLLENARNYTPNDGAISISTYEEDIYCVIEITDTGIGIPAEDLIHIWERLYRVDKSRSRETGGMGLGLAICKEIVELHQGHIQVVSTKGIGTTFRVRLPLLPNNP